MEIERALATQPVAAAYNALGAWFAERNQSTCAIAAFRNAIRLNPNAVEGHFNLALAVQPSDLKQAIRELEIASKLDASRAQVHLALGVALEESGQLAAAEAELRTSLRLDPQSIRALIHLSAVLMAQKRPSVAVRYLNQALALDPRDPDLAERPGISLC